MIPETDYMIKNKIFNIKSRKGRIMKIVKEHYLRDDIFCGSELCQTCVMTAKTRKLKKFIECVNLIQAPIHYIIPDTNIFLHQMHLFENDIYENMIVLQTVLEEIKSKNYSIFKRICELILNPERNVFSFANEHHIDTYCESKYGETINDRNDRAIRVATNWYNKHLENFKIISILITNDIKNKQLAISEGLKSMDLKDYIQTYYKNKDEMIDKMFSVVSKEDLHKDIYDENNQITFPEHLPTFEVENGIKSGKYHKGTFMMSRNNYLEADVSLFNIDQDLIFIKGLKNMNRAVHQDIVAIEIMPESLWVKPSDLLLENENEIDNDDIILPKDTNSINDLSKTVSTKNKPRKTGIVVSILKRKWRPYTGFVILPYRKDTLQSTSSNWYTFVPTESRIPRIRIQLSKSTLESFLISDQSFNLVSEDNTDQRKSKLLVVHIDSWPPHSRYPKGHYVKTLGNIGDKESQNEALLIEHDIKNYEYPLKALKCLPQPNWKISDQDIKERVDLRTSRLIFSIDPPGCTDVDDALHCYLLPNNHLEVGVHIADVTHFVELNKDLDLEARDRATTVYLVDKRIEMLPTLLSSDICSLLANRDRLAFSVIWEIEAETGHIIKMNFSKSLIRSSAKLTYEEAQNILNLYSSVYHLKENANHNHDDNQSATKWRQECLANLSFNDDETLNDQSDLLANIGKSIYLLHNLAKILKQKRLDKGALILSSSEMKFLMDSETNEPVTLSPKQNFETNSLVEEMMLLANITVATKIHSTLGQCAVLRRHQSPPLSNFDPLIRAANTLNIKLDIDNGKALAMSLDKAETQEEFFSQSKLKKIEEHDDPSNSEPEILITPSTTPYLITLLRVLTARCMMEALYFCSGTLSHSEFFHYGLATEIYTHFTSPIRRYADIMVHRLLAVCIGYQEIDPQMQDKNFIQNICNHLNTRNRNSRNAQRASVELQIQLYFKDKVIDDEAYIIGVRKNAIRVLVPKYGIEGSIYLKSTVQNAEEILNRLKYDEQESTLTYSHNDYKISTLRCFDKVQVRMGLITNFYPSNQSHLSSLPNNNKLTIRLIKPHIPGFETYDYLRSSNVIQNVDSEGTTDKISNKKMKI
ncbi:unnamed protein product [Gordionus sp. m RMFG-2023]|uniref:exosome complex exonuclease RRP44-like n=1 Tax=Gordionus sp. m RMFG-2023 TaxID=3053472 RepID=UPI0030E4F4FA